METTMNGEEMPTGTSNVELKAANCVTGKEVLDADSESEFGPAGSNAAALSLCFDLLEHVAKELRYIDFDKGIICLNDSNDLSKALFTVYNYLKKKTENRDPSAARMLGSVKLMGKESTELKVKDIASRWTGRPIFDFRAATPIVGMLTAFPWSFREALRGVTMCTVRGASTKARPKRGDGKRNITDFGLHIRQASLLEGSTFPTECKMGLLRNLGPLTLALVALHETECFDDVAHALGESINWLPGHLKEGIIAVLKGQPRDGYQQMLQSLGDLLLLTPALTTHGLYMPIIFAHRLWKGLSEKDLMKHWSFSSAAMVYLVQLTLAEVNFKIRTRASPAHIKQVAYHAMYGTTFECFHMLKQITDNKCWSTGQAIRATLKKKEAAAPAEVTFPFIQMEYVSKMAREDPIKAPIEAPEAEQVRAERTDLGKRTFLEAFAKMNPTKVDHNPVRYAFALAQTRNNLLADWRKGKRDLLLGSSDWFCVQTGRRSDKRFMEEGVSSFGAVLKEKDNDPWDICY